MNMADWYRIVYEQKKPIHIGGRKYGVISETRLFMPGWTVFGALVNACALQQKSPAAFETWQKKLMSITCFFPALGTENEDILFPEVSCDGLQFKSEKTVYDEHDFRRRFVNSYLSTAIDPVSLSAAQESTHEMEVILPEERKARGVAERYQLYWTGLLKAEKEDIEAIEKSESFYIGQDARYGLGELKLCSIQIITNEEIKHYWGMNIEYDRIYISDNRPLRNFLDMDVLKHGVGKVLGTKELIVTEFDFISSAVPVIKEYYFAISPGSKIHIKNKLELALKKGLLTTLSR